MIAKEALDAAKNVGPGERLRRYETGLRPVRALSNERSRPVDVLPRLDCLTVFDNYGKIVNRIPEIQ